MALTSMVKMTFVMKSMKLKICIVLLPSLKVTGLPTAKSTVPMRMQNRINLSKASLVTTAPEQHGSVTSQRINTGTHHTVVARDAPLGT